jgi:glycosyltransferase involved in cell wall biosynthesis
VSVNWKARFVRMTNKGLAMKYSVVVPVYNSSKSLKELCQRIDVVFQGLKKSYEIILVDDGSKDNSWQVMKQIQKEKQHVTIIQLMRNFGQHNTTLCGLNQASGDYIITIDDDLQSLPEDIPKLINKIDQGYDAVFAAVKKKKDKQFKIIGSWFIQKLNRMIFDTPRHLKVNSFRIMTRDISDQLIQYKTPYPYISGMILSMTNKIENVVVGHDQRRHGASTYTVFKLFKLAFNLVINYSALPLNVFAGMGFIVSAFSFTYGLLMMLKKVFIGVPVEGWTSVIVLLSFLNGILITMLSLMGEYLVRILGEVSARNQFVIRKKIKSSFRHSGSTSLSQDN